MTDGCCKCGERCWRVGGEVACGFAGDPFEGMSDDEIRAELDKSPFVPKHPPTDEQVERAKQIARERGFLTDDGFTWER